MHYHVPESEHGDQNPMSRTPDNLQCPRLVLGAGKAAGAGQSMRKSKQRFRSECKKVITNLKRPAYQILSKPKYRY